MTFSTFKTSLATRCSLLRSALLRVSIGMLLTLLSSTSHAEALAPPTLGEQTKGKPAIAETEPAHATTQTEQEKNIEQNQSPLGTATVTEHKRENGQVYLIEIEHSLGGKQYLYENDSDGQIGSSVEDNDDIKEIPKWKLGSW